MCQCSRYNVSMLSVQAESKQHDIDYVLSVPGHAIRIALAFSFRQFAQLSCHVQTTQRVFVYLAVLSLHADILHTKHAQTSQIKGAVSVSLISCLMHKVCCIVRHDANGYVTPAVKKSCVPIQTFCQSSSAYAATLEPPTKKFGLNLDKSPTLLAVLFFLLLACALMRAFMSARLALFINRNCPSLAKPALHQGDQFF